LETASPEAPREAGRLTWFTVEDTVSLSAAHYQWSCERSLGLEEITGLRLCSDANGESRSDTEIELLTPSKSCGVHRFRFVSSEERRQWVEKLSEVIFSRECRAAGATNRLAALCPHCTSTQLAPGDAGWCPHVGDECLWQPSLGAKKNSQQLVQVVYRGWPDFAKPCTEKGHRQQWLGLILSRPILRGGDGTVKGVQYYAAASGCGRMIATASVRCSPVPLGWVAPEILEPETEPEPEPEPEQGAHSRTASRTARVQPPPAGRRARPKGMRPEEGDPPDSCSTRPQKKTIERQAGRSTHSGAAGGASRLERLAQPKRRPESADQLRPPSREVRTQTHVEPQARSHGRAQRRGATQARSPGQGRGPGVGPGSRRGRGRGRGRGREGRTD
jgi:hypothetical protein